MKSRNTFALLFILLGFAFCRGPDYPELRRLFVDAGQVFRDYRIALERSDTAAAAVDVMKTYNERIAGLLQRKEQIQEKYPELRELSQLRQTCNRLEEFQNFRENFNEFYRTGDAIARKFDKDQSFKIESRRGRSLILRIL